MSSADESTRRPRRAQARPHETRREVAQEGGAQRDQSETWKAVERGERLTTNKVLELYPGISKKRLAPLPVVSARRPNSHGHTGCWYINTYLRSDVEALARKVAAEQTDPTWLAVERGERLTTKQVAQLYPSISSKRILLLPSVRTRKLRQMGTRTASGCKDVNTYLRSDVEALAAEVAAERADPTWQAVERGERITTAKARELYPSVPKKRVCALPSAAFAWRPKPAGLVSTYLRSDVEALAVELELATAPPAPKRPRVEKAARPRVDKTPPRVDPCPVCLEDLGDDATALDCGHRIHASCLEEYSKNAWADGTAATRTRRGTRLTCPCCRAPSLVADPGIRVGDEVEAKWDGSWYPGSIDEVLSEEGSYEVLWDTGEVNPIPARDVRARA